MVMAALDVNLMIAALLGGADLLATDAKLVTVTIRAFQAPSLRRSARGLLS